MSVTLPVTVDVAPAEQVALDVLVAPFFETDRPLRGPSARVDWRLCGLLSERLTEARIAGRVGEAVLLPSSGRMRAPQILLLGLGPRPGFSEAALRGVAQDAARRCVALRAGNVGFALPAEAVLGVAARASARAVVTGTALALAERPAALALRLLVVPEEDRAARLGATDAVSAAPEPVRIRMLREEQLGERLTEAPSGIAESARAPWAGADYGAS